MYRRTFNENRQHYPAFGIDIAWESQTVDLILQRSPKTKEKEYSLLHIDFNTEKTLWRQIDTPDEAVYMDRETKIGRLLLAYNRGLPGSTDNFPLVTPHLRLLLKKLDNVVLNQIPETFSEIFVSPNLEYLLACNYERSERSIDESEFISTITILDLDSKSVVRTVEIPYQLTTILFR